MEIRGNRECRKCGSRWSYYDTGSVACPNCGSLRSTGRDERRKLHTDSPATFDLDEVRALAHGVTDAELASTAADVAREYVHQRGFVNGGELRPLDDTYLAAAELAAIGSELARRSAPSDGEELYFLSLLRSADDGERPSPESVPTTLRDARGLAYTDAVREYRRDVDRWLDAENEPPGEGFARDTIERLGDHVKRIRALQGDVPPTDAEALVEAARGFGAYLRADDPDGLETCRRRLDELVE